ncbi:hypothetical protein GCM10011335_37370 [Aureimonas glaciei]|uniref:Uncharacterized protein n=1 Tax=Aureimonas glaciei TaxID=1776957 RepID=A0A916Y4P7_9HYPH|nr:hypothetical protein GCM10011335_37370 [Aureimonas glaciei]
MIRWWKSLFAWHAVRSTPVWLYSENAVTGQRMASLRTLGLWSPIDRGWLRDGDIIDGRRGRYVIGTEDEIIYG